MIAFLGLAWFIFLCCRRRAGAFLFWPRQIADSTIATPMPVSSIIHHSTREHSSVHRELSTVSIHHPRGHQAARPLQLVNSSHTRLLFFALLSPFFSKLLCASLAFFRLLSACKLFVRFVSSTSSKARGFVLFSFSSLFFCLSAQQQTRVHHLLVFIF